MCSETRETEFSPSKIRRNSHTCKVCSVKETMLWRLDNPQAHRDEVKRWRLKNPLKANERVSNWRKNHPEEWYEIRMRYHYKNMDKYRCQGLALKEYPDSQVCEVGECSKFGQRHHDDYTKPLEVRWLCIKHHKQVHSKVLV